MSYDNNLPPQLAHDSHFNNEEIKSCPTCKGTGKIEDYGEGETCPSCEGEGEVEWNFRTIKQAIEERQAEDNDIETETNLK